MGLYIYIYIYIYICVCVCACVCRISPSSRSTRVHRNSSDLTSVFSKKFLLLFLSRLKVRLLSEESRLDLIPGLRDQIKMQYSKRVNGARCLAPPSRGPPGMEFVSLQQAHFAHAEKVKDITSSFTTPLPIMLLVLCYDIAFCLLFTLSIAPLQ